MPLNMAISPDGKSLYAGSTAMDGFASYDRDPATGALTKRPGCFSFDGGWVKNTTTDGTPCTVVPSLRKLYSLHVAPDGKNLYVVSQKHITTFDRDPDGQRDDAHRHDVVPLARRRPRVERGQRQPLHGRGRHEHHEADGVRAGLEPRLRGRRVQRLGGLPRTRSRCSIARPTARSRGARRRPPRTAASPGTTARWSAGSCRTARAIGLIRAWTMSPDGKQLYVTGDQRGIAIIDRDPTTGLLSDAPCRTGASPRRAAPPTPAPRRPGSAASAGTRCARSTTSP